MAADGVERFQLTIFLCLIVILDWNGPSTLAMEWRAYATILGVEAATDWVKHLFAAKFNRLRPELYHSFVRLLARDAIRARQLAPAALDPMRDCSHRMGLSVLPLVAVAARVMQHKLSRAKAPRTDGTSMWGMCVPVLSCCCLLALKGCVSLLLLGWSAAVKRQAKKERETREREIERERVGIEMGMLDGDARGGVGRGEVEHDGTSRGGIGDRADCAGDRNDDGERDGLTAVKQWTDAFAEDQARALMPDQSWVGLVDPVREQEESQSRGLRMRARRRNDGLTHGAIDGGSEGEDGNSHDGPANRRLQLPGGGRGSTEVTSVTDDAHLVRAGIHRRGISTASASSSGSTDLGLLSSGVGKETETDTYVGIRTGTMSEMDSGRRSSGVGSRGYERHPSVGSDTRQYVDRGPAGAESMGDLPSVRSVRDLRYAGSPMVDNMDI